VEQLLNWTGPEANGIEVLDVMGRVVIQGRDQGPDRRPIDVSALPPGTYTLRLTDANGSNLATARFVKAYAPMVR
jgi:hypothetical protein